MTRASTRSRQSRMAETDGALLRLHRLFGWTTLLLWLLFGTTLEALHGFKVADYLLNDVRREFWSLAHFHGVAFALVNLVYVRWAEADGLSAAQRQWASRGLLAASVLMPVGFVLGGLTPFEGDPGVGIFLSPLGAAALLATAGLQAMAAWKEKGEG